jgi:hypothetical protein
MDVSKASNKRLTGGAAGFRTRPPVSGTVPLARFGPPVKFRPSGPSSEDDAAV